MRVRTPAVTALAITAITIAYLITAITTPTAAITSATGYGILHSCLLAVTSKLLRTLHDLFALASFDVI